MCECLSSYHEQADRTCVPPLAPALPRVAAGEAGAGAGAGAAGSVIAAVICVLALAVLSVLGVLFVRYLHYLSIIFVQNKYLHILPSSPRRYRLLPRLKARLTNTPYEDIVISDTHKATIRQTAA